MLHLCISALSLLTGPAQFAQGPGLRTSSLGCERGRAVLSGVVLRPGLRSEQREVDVNAAASVQAAPPELSCAQRVVDELLRAAELLNSRGECVLQPADVETALDDMHLLNRTDEPQPEGAAPPSEFLPEELLAPRSVDVTALVRESLPRVLATHPIFLQMAEELLHEQFYASVYFGWQPRDATPSLSFAQLSRRLVASIYVFEQLVAMPHHRRRYLAAHYESKLAAARRAAVGAAAPSRSMRETLMGGFLDLKGESVLASINVFEMLHRSGAASLRNRAPAADADVSQRMQAVQPAKAGFPSSPSAARGVEITQPGGAGVPDHSLPRDAPSLSNLLNSVMGVNILEAVLSNLSFAFWPDNARAGMALLMLNGAPFSSDLEQQLDAGWWALYLAWNANFIWPSHHMKDMMCFTMLLMPTIALGGPRSFAYNRAHTLFWVVRSAQLSRLRDDRTRSNALPGDAQRTLPPPCFHCREAPQPYDRQPLTTRMARLTRAAGERLAAAAGEDVSGAGVWWRLATREAPAHLGLAWDLYKRMPKVSSTKLRLS